MRTIRTVSSLLAVVLAAGSAGAGSAVEFAATTDLAAAGMPFGGVVGDVTGDGKPDVVLAPNRASNVVVHPGMGDGTFGAPFTVATFPLQYATRIRAAKLNSDDALDLVVNHQNAMKIDVLLSDGSGGFTLTTYTTIGTSYVVPALSDWDGDGKVNLLVADTNGSAKVRVRLNDGSGTFGDEAQIALGPGPGSATDFLPADLDGDGRVNLGVGGRIFWRNSDGTVTTDNVGIAMPYPYGASLTAADVNADGRLDVVTVAAVSSHHVVTVRRQTSARHFAPPESYTLGTVALQQPWSVAVSDLNGDGHPDVVTPGLVFMNKGDGTFGPAKLLPFSGFGVTAGDLDADARPEIVVVGSSDPSRGSGKTFDGATLLSVGDVAGPTIASISPATLFQGGTRDVHLIGTGFEPRSIVEFGAGVVLDTTTIETAQSIRANVRIETDAAIGPSSVKVTSPSGGSASISFSIAADGTAQFVSISPDRAHSGDTLDVRVKGVGFLDGLQAAFGNGVAVNSIQLVSANEFTMNLTVLSLPGASDLTITNGSGIVSVASGVFTVLPARSIDLTAERGRLRVAPRGTFTVSGSMAFNAFSPDGVFFAATESAEIRFGDPAAPSVLAIAADRGWRIHGSRAIWRSPRRAQPQVTLALDFAKNTFRLDIARASLAPTATDRVLVEMTLGEETGTSVRIWTAGRRGTLVLK